MTNTTNMDAFKLEQIYQLEQRKKAILGKLKTNLSANKRNDLLREYNELNELV